MNTFLIRLVLSIVFFFQFTTLSCDSKKDKDGDDQNPNLTDGQPENLDAGYQDSADVLTSTVDCDHLPSLPLSFTVYDDMICAEDFTFDNEGYLLGIDATDQNLYRVEKGKRQNYCIWTWLTTAEGLVCCRTAISSIRIHL